MPRGRPEWAGSEVSEFSYAQWLTSEVVERLGGVAGLAAAAVIPSLRQEAELGVDVVVPGDWVTLFLQYKMSKYLSTRRAPQWEDMGSTPYYRFELKTDATKNGKSQHNVLCELQVKGAGTTDLVYYAAPLFTAFERFNSAVLSGALIDESVFVPPMVAGPWPFGSQHFFAYTSAADVTPFSTPGEPVLGSFDAVTSQLRNLVSPGRVTLSQHLARSWAAVVAVLAVDVGEYNGPASLAHVAALLGAQAVVVRVRD